ncbi:MAG: phycobilisome protein [Cyanobacteria bacterium P01_A01_bin.17]
MHSDFQRFLQDAEDHYLTNAEITDFKQHVSALEQRLQTYELLRDKEQEIWQPIADQLEATCPNDNAHRQEKALQHWISALRYGAMAMLSNNPEFLRHRLLEWLTDAVQAHQLADLEYQLSQLLEARLKEVLSAHQWTLIQPYLTQTQQILVGNNLVTAG